MFVSLGDVHHRLGSSPACAVSTATNFYIQATPTHPHSHTPGPIPTPTVTPGPSPAQLNVTGPNGPKVPGSNSSCSLAKLQQLTNGLENMVPPPSGCNTMTPPPVAMNLTPPPSHHAMTPPPHQLHNQSVRNLTTPPAISSNLQSQVTLANYHKYYQTNMNMNVNQLSGAVTPPIGQNLGRTSRNSNVTQHMQTSSRVSPNVTINPNIMAQYGSLNGYRMTAQQSAGAVTGYITNGAGFINNTTQIPMQMGVMNMAQTQYQDPAAIQRAQQNTMYTTYSYINGSLINGTMRR